MDFYFYKVFNLILQSANILKNLVKGKETIIFIAHNFNQEMRALFDREIHLVKD